MPKPTVSIHKITTSYGDSDLRVFEPTSGDILGTVVTVHPWSFLGGGEHNTIGIADKMSTKGWRVITFTLKSAPLYLGGAIGGILFRHYHEVNHITEVVEWAFEQYNTKMVLLGSSAGAPFAGSAMAKIQQRQKTKIAAYIAVGYTFGNFAKLGFGRHFSSVIGNSASIFCGSSSSSDEAASSTPPPKYFIMGEKDEFTSVEQLESMVTRMKSINSNCKVDIEIVPSVGHFELESPSYDPFVAEKVVQWLEDVIL